MKATHERTLKKMEEELKLAGYSPRTVDSYLGAASRFLRHVDKPASRLGAGDLREYFLFLADEKKAASSTINQAHFGVRFLYRDVLGSHRVAISNHRLLHLENDRVVFRWKGYRAEGEQKLTSLHGVEFVRRYLMHVLPVGFQRIRSYGLLANRHRSKHLERCRHLLGVSVQDPDPAEESADGSGEVEEALDAEIERLAGLDPLRCPACGKGRLSLLGAVAARAERVLALARAPP